MIFHLQFPQRRLVFLAETTPRAIHYLRVPANRQLPLNATTATIFIMHGRQSDVSRSAAFLSIHIRTESRQHPLYLYLLLFSLMPRSEYRSPRYAQLTPNLSPIIRGRIRPPLNVYTSSRSRVSIV